MRSGNIKIQCACLKNCKYFLCGKKSCYTRFLLLNTLLREPLVQRWKLLYVYCWRWLYNYYVIATFCWLYPNNLLHGLIKVKSCIQNCVARIYHRNTSSRKQTITQQKCTKLVSPIVFCFVKRIWFNSYCFVWQTRVVTRLASALPPFARIVRHSPALPNIQ